jgi:hypothetical protein
MAHGGKRSGSGRKKGSSALPRVAPEIKAELREVAREYAGKALETLVKVCESSRSDSAKVAAANALLDRGYGKPLQQIESGKAGDFSRKSDEELLAILNEPLDFDLESIALGNGSPSKH